MTCESSPMQRLSTLLPQSRSTGIAFGGWQRLDTERQTQGLLCVLLAAALRLGDTSHASPRASGPQEEEEEEESLQDGA